MSRIAPLGKRAVSNLAALAMKPHRGMHGLAVGLRARQSRIQIPRPRILLTLATWAAWCSPLVAIERGITVSGTGEARARPTHVEIDVSVNAAAELTADAIQKYRDSLRRTTEAFKKLEMKDLTIEERELSFGNSAPGDDDEDGNFNVFGGGGGAPAAAKPQVHISRALRLALGGIDQLDEPTLMESIGTLLDTARDVSATVAQSSSNALLAQMMGQQSGSSSMVTFVINDAAEQHEKAYQEAFAEAKARATRLARLSGTTLGEVIAIQEAADAGMDSETALMISAINDATGDKSKRSNRLTTDKLGEIPVRVTLWVRFMIGAKKDQLVPQERGGK